ncbi:nuclear transport factor 2 family protein [Maricurvus nonylphenolicus]|uniref:hypothetical protein n=1 Tax=Maricurvus nonylphenolicus TaxID=1008307 RepID=UPI0036F432E4
MKDYPEALDHMLAAWNEPDASLVRGHLDKALSSNVRFVDPSIDVSGIDGFEKNVHEVKANIPGAVYSRASGVDSQHNFHRYHWEIHQDGKLLLSGFDVTETDDEDRVSCVIGFFGEIPQD